jgi:predicted 3-demethylubiquinone-9 3-methyltransferase (glyoxalase superfamily)
MAIGKQKIAPCLWFDTQAEEAAKFYVSIFPNSRLGAVSRYGEAGQEIHGKPPGSVMVVEFEIDGQRFIALNGGPQFKFSEAVSFQIYCDTQAEIDHFWSKLGKDGQEGSCGWLKDKFGLSWQIVPTALPKMMASGDARTTDRVMASIMSMKKFDMAALQKVYDGKS